MKQLLGTTFYRVKETRKNLEGKCLKDKEILLIYSMEK